VQLRAEQHGHPRQPGKHGQAADHGGLRRPPHKAVLAGELPYTIGGGIGQSRLCMLLLGSVHIGEVQASVWDKATREACAKAGIPLL